MHIVFVPGGMFEADIPANGTRVDCIGFVGISGLVSTRENTFGRGKRCCIWANTLPGLDWPKHGRDIGDESLNAADGQQPCANLMPLINTMPPSAKKKLSEQLEERGRSARRRDNLLYTYCRSIAEFLRFSFSLPSAFTTRTPVIFSL